jgi:2-dehydro-3-deoxyphosphogluconate aldolase/(4S)-4-hydroxy-2-oxoglutarate aldolase
VFACGVVAVLRFGDARHLRPAAEALAAGGVVGLEVTLTTPGAVDAIRDLAADAALADRCVVGAGTVLDAGSARRAIDAGARFVVSPVLDVHVVALCREQGTAVLPGALTPTEILRAWDAGADAVKVFPSSAVGPGYFRDVLAPLPHVRLVPTGGVSLENVDAWVRAGAVAVGVGSSLADPALVAAGRTGELTARARAYVDRVQTARAALRNEGRDA